MMKKFFGYDVHQLLKQLDSTKSGETMTEFKSFLISSTTYLEKRFYFSENSTFGRLSNLSLKDYFPKYAKFIEIVKYFKLREGLNLDMDKFFDEISLIQKSFSEIRISQGFAQCK